MITADKSDPNKLVARTCGIWSGQYYEKEWSESSMAWGDYFFKSTDGGKTWTNITTGQNLLIQTVMTGSTVRLSIGEAEF